MKSLKELCEPRPSVFDRAKRDTVLDLADLAEDNIKPEAFFEENYVTDAMRILLREGFRRLEGKSDQGVFLLRQAMGGGKTHTLLAFGLLARYPKFRKKVLADIYDPDPKLGDIKVVSFTGRETDTPLGIWGAIADQLGKKDLFKEYYSPLQAPGQSSWVRLLEGERVLILLDELPPYLDNAFSKQVGDSNLAKVTATALTNLLVAIEKGKLPQVCLVLTDLAAKHYQQASAQISGILEDLKDEAGRFAMSLEPVRLNGDELYHILRTRLFKSLPSETDIHEVAQAYAKALREARQMGVTDESPEQFSARIEDAYPFHPAIKDLYARFRENPGFQQTRALIRLMRIMVSRLWESGEAEAKLLVGAHDLDLNEHEMLSEISSINSTLGNAVSHDIAAEGKAVAEVMDANLGGHDTMDAARLLFMASLPNVPNAVMGLSIPELLTYLAEPGRDVSRMKADVLEKFATAAWYLHANKDGKLFFRNVENLNAKLESISKNYVREQAVKEVRQRLQEMFEPRIGWCYQSVQALPAADEIDLQQDKVTLVVCEPTPGRDLSLDLKRFYEDATWKNRVAFLTGTKNTFDDLIETGKRLKAIQSIIEDDFIASRVPETDPQYKQALDLLDKLQQNFLSACRETFTILHYPIKPPSSGDAVLNSGDFAMKFEGNSYRGEDQIQALLKGKQKFTEDISGDVFRKKCEQRLFTASQMQWSEVRRRAAMDTSWQWHKPGALDSLKEECVHKDLWREEGSYVNKGPFEAGGTSLKVQERSRDDDTGEVELKITPINSDTVYAEVGGKPTRTSEVVENGIYRTDELHVSFLAVDSTGKHPDGEPVTWNNRITLKHRVYQNGKKRMLELQAAPRGTIRYSTDGANPRVSGGTYNGAVAIPEGTPVVQALAEADGVESEILTIPIDWEKDSEVTVDPAKPAVWDRKQRNSTTKESYGFLKRLAACEARASGIKIEVTGSRWIEVQMHEEIELASSQLQDVTEAIRKLLEEGQVGIDADRVHFEKGQDLLDWVHEAKTELKAGEVKQ